MRTRPQLMRDAEGVAYNEINKRAFRDSAYKRCLQLTVWANHYQRDLKAMLEAGGVDPEPLLKQVRQDRDLRYS